MSAGSDSVSRISLCQQGQSVSAGLVCVSRVRQCQQDQSVSPGSVCVSRVSLCQQGQSVSAGSDSVSRVSLCQQGQTVSAGSGCVGRVVIERPRDAAGWSTFLARGRISPRASLEPAAAPLALAAAGKKERPSQRLRWGAAPLHRRPADEWATRDQLSEPSCQRRRRCGTGDT